MRFKITQYILIFISLIALYLFVSDINKSEAFSASKERMSKRVDILKDSIEQLATQQKENSYFSLPVYSDSQQLHPDFNPIELHRLLEDYIFSTNGNQNGNPLLFSLGYDFIINKIYVVNHRWVMIHFTNGVQWGDALVSYEIKTNGKPRLSLLNHVKYP